MSTPERVMLLIDADNVSVDVMEQAIRLLLNQHGGLHVRRAYCTAESAVKHQSAFKRLAIKPMVNLAAGKNSTDIALAVDAIDLVLAERPDVVVIASSDSDFAPLVQRLREKGCVVRGIGQKGKTGEETQDVYDDFTVLEHRKGEAPARPARKTPARKATSRKATAAAESPPAEPVPAAPDEPAPKRAAARKKSASLKGAVTRGSSADGKAHADADAKADANAVAMADVVADLMAESAASTEPSPPPAKRARKTASTKTAATKTASTKTATRKSVPPPAAPADARVEKVLAVLPELLAGQSLALNVAVQRLREARLLGRNAPSTRFFAVLADRFELVPAGNPTKVLLRS